MLRHMLRNRFYRNLRVGGRIRTRFAASVLSPFTGGEGFSEAIFLAQIMLDGRGHGMRVAMATG